MSEENLNEIIDEEVIEEEEEDNSRFIIKVADLDPNRNMPYVLKLRQTTTSLMYAALGVLAIIFVKITWLRIIGGALLILPAILNFTVIKNTTIFECNDEYCVAVSMNQPEYAYKFNWDDVVTYAVEKTPNGPAMMKVMLPNELGILIPSSSSSLIKQFTKHIPGKERMALFNMQREEYEAMMKARKEKAKEKKKNKTK